MQTLLRMNIILARCWPKGTFASKVAPECTEPILQVALTVFQHGIHPVEQRGLEGAAPLLPELVTQWETATEALWSVCRSFDLSGSKQGSGLQQQQTLNEPLLQCASLLPCVTLDMATRTYALQLLQRQDPGLVAAAWTDGAPDVPTVGSCSGSSGSSTSRTNARNRPSRGTTGRGSSGRAAMDTMEELSARVSGNSGATIVQCAAQMLADLPASDSKLFALVGCGSEPVILAAAAKAAQLRAKGTCLIRTQGEALLHAVDIYKLLAQHFKVRERAQQSSLHAEQGLEQQAHILVPALLLRFAAMQTTLPVDVQFPELDRFVGASALAIFAARCRGTAFYLLVPADLQQVLLQDVLPTVVQFSSAMLGLPGPAAYRGYGSGSSSSSTAGSSMQNSTPETPAVPVTGYASAYTQTSPPATPAVNFLQHTKLATATSLLQCLCCAAHSAEDASSTITVPAAALGSHVLAVGQLVEAAVRQIQQPIADDYDCSDLSSSQVAQLSMLSTSHDQFNTTSSVSLPSPPVWSCLRAWRFAASSRQCSSRRGSRCQCGTCQAAVCQPVLQHTQGCHCCGSNAGSCHPACRYSLPDHCIGSNSHANGSVRHKRAGRPAGQLHGSICCAMASHQRACAAVHGSTAARCSSRFCTRDYHRSGRQQRCTGHAAASVRRCSCSCRGVGVSTARAAEGLVSAVRQPSCPPTDDPCVPAALCSRL